MKLRIFTIALDAMPFITWHLPVLNQLGATVDWHWYIAEGAAMNVKDTSWCVRQPPRLSRDGTTEYLHAIRNHPRVTVIQQQKWEGKVAQCNACLDRISDPCVLLQMDADELWTPHELHRLSVLFEHFGGYNAARFFCNYMVGQNIHITSTNGYGNRPSEWLRAWNFVPGQRFERHEPPVMAGRPEICLTREQTRDFGLSFEHYAYVFEKQVAFKGQWYNYPNAVVHWRRLQENKIWPVKLKNFLPWVGDDVIANVLYK